MVPLERRVGSGTLRVLSMGFLADEEQAIMWRGLVLNRAVQQFLQDAHWGDLDYLLIDLPPGTGDIQMGLARLLPRTEMLVVTTPPLAAQKVAARAADMARRGYLRVAGVIENMSDFTCEHGTTYALFGSGGGQRLAQGLGVPLVGSIPLHPDLAAAGDAGVPVAWRAGSELGAVFAELARVVTEEVAPLLRPTAAPPACSSGWRRRWPRERRRRPAEPTPCQFGGQFRRPVRRPGGGQTALDGVLAGRRVGGGPVPPGRGPAGGPRARTRHRELALGDVAVDLGEQLVDGPVSARRRARPPTALVTAQPMGDQRVDDVGHVVHEAPVTRSERAHGRHLVAHTGQAVQVLVQVAVGRPDDHRRAVHDVVTGQQQCVLLDQPAQVVRGVARRVQGRAGSGHLLERDRAAPSPRPPARRGRSPRPARSR